MNSYQPRLGWRWLLVLVFFLFLLALGGCDVESVVGRAVTDCDGRYEYDATITNDGTESVRLTTGFSTETNAITGKDETRDESADPSQFTLGTGASNSQTVKVVGYLVDPCQSSISYLEFVKPDGEKESTPREVGAAPIDARAPRTSPRQNKFSYDVSIKCCEDGDKGEYVISVEGVNVENISASPNALGCSVEEKYTVTITGKVVNMDEKAIVNVRVKDPVGDSCTVKTELIGD